MSAAPSNLPGEPLSIAIAATFTAEPLQQSLAFWAQELAMPASIAFAPYNQVFQQLLDPASLFAANRTGINVVLLRFEDWQPENPEESETETRQRIEQNVRDLIGALKGSAGRSSAPHLVCVCSASPGVAADPLRAPIALQMEARLTSGLEEATGVQIVTMAELAASYPVGKFYDAHTDKLASIPYTPVFFTALGTLIARKIYALNNAAYKVIVLDADQTLWKGVVGEDGAQGVQIDPVRKTVQAFLVRQHDAGMLICVCSKNDEADVAQVFQNRPDMVLKRQHVVSWRVNWRPKSENIRSIARELRLGLDSFIFIDDDPVECAEVQANCPEVLTFLLPQEVDTIPRFLDHLWVFDRLKLTDEDKARTALYQENTERARYREEAPSLHDFLAGLNLKIRISTATPNQLARVSELTRRTNQFNFTNIRRSESQIQALCLPGETECLVVHVKDRFGDYGLVGVIIYQTDSAALTVETFLLSCRALGRGVEHKMAAMLGETAVRRGLPRIDVRFIGTARNQPALDFLQSLVGEFKKPQGNDLLFSFPANFLAALTYRPIAPRETVPVEPDSSGPATTPAVSTQAKARLLRSIAAELYDPKQIQGLISLMSAQARPRPELETAYVAPRTEGESKVAQIFSELSGIQEIGVNDDFFGLGGHSLLATQVLTRMADAFHIEMSPRLFFSGELTVASLAKTAIEQQIKQMSRQDVAAMLEQIKALSDDEVEVLLSARRS